MVYLRKISKETVFMKIFLKEDIKSLGRMGEIVDVNDGYARNYLFPKKMAVEAHTKNIKEFEHQKKVIQEKAAKIREASNSVAEKLSALTLTIKAKAGEEEKLFGSVTNMDIANALKAEGFEIDKKKITMGEPIKRLGLHSVEVKIHPEVSATLKVHVVPE
jgi:large subunit ribosomal protein L9